MSRLLSLLDWRRRVAALRPLALLAALLTAAVPARAWAQFRGGPVVTLTPGTTTFTGSTMTYTVTGIYITVCNKAISPKDLDDSSKLFLLDGASVASSFTQTGGAPSGCIFGRQYSGSVVLATTQDGDHTFEFGIDDLDGYHGGAIAHYIYRWPGWVAPHYTVRVVAAAHTKDVAPGAGRTATFTVTNLGSRTATYHLTARCVRAASCDSTGLSTRSVTLDTVTRSVTATLTFTGGTLGDTGSVTVAAHNTGGGLSADVDSATTDIMLPAPIANNSPGVVIAGSGDVVARDQCLTVSAGDGAAYECGDLRLAHALPTVTTRGKARTPVLLYNSAHATGNATVAADVTPVTNMGTLDSVVAKVLVAGVQWGRGSWPGTQWPGDSTRRIGIAIDSLKSTGIYGYTLNVQYFWHTGSTTTDTPTGQLVVVNRSASNLGAGWWVAGVEQLVDSGGAKLWIGGDGSTHIYRPTAIDTVDVAVTGLRPDTLYATKVAGVVKGYYRRLPSGTKVEFNSAGQDTATRPLVGRATYFIYSGTSLTDSLRQITVPSAAADGNAYVHYAFSYYPDSVVVQLVVNGTTQRRTVALKSGGKITAIRDPDGTSVSLSYLSNSARVAHRTDQNGHTTRFGYDAARHLTSDSLTVTGVGTVVESFTPAESRGILGTSAAAAQSLDSTYTLLDGPRTDVADVMRVWPNKYGGPARIKNAYGRETKLYFDATWPALPDSVRSPGGTVTKGWYNNRGLIDSTKIRNLRFAGDGSPATKYTWDSRFAQPTLVTGADSSVTSYGYNADGTIQFVQRGTNSSARVTVAYWTSSDSGLYSGSSVPGRTERDSVRYDQVLANPDSTMDTGGHWTRYGRDVLGQVVYTETPISASDIVRDSTQYDLAGQVVRHVVFGPVTHYTPQSDSRGTQTVPADTLIVTTTYDSAGHPLQVQRTAKPARNGVSTTTTTYSYDEAGRKTSEVPDYGAGSTITYDPAGNVVQLVGEHGHQSMVYDEMNRLVQRVALQRVYSDTSCAMFVPDAAYSGCTFAFPLSTGGSGNYTVPGDTDSFTYDAAGNLTRADNRSARIRRTYSPGGLLLTDTSRIRTLRFETQGSTVATNDFTSHVYGLRYGYDAAGRRDSLWHPDVLDPCSGACPAQRYQYDGPTGRLVSVVGVDSGIVSFGYTLAGQLDTVSYPGGVKEITNFNALGVPSSRTAIGTVISDSLLYDWAGRVTTGTGHVVRDGSTQTIYNAYSGLGALVEQEWIPSASTPKLEEFRYDALGNQMYTRRRHVILGASPDDPQWRANSYDAAGRLTRTFVPDTTLLASGTVQAMGDTILQGELRGVWYDAYGRTSFTGGSSWSNHSSPVRYHQERSYYDGQGRLAMVEAHVGGGNQPSDYNDPSAVIESYRYDALGRRVLVHALRNTGANCPAKGCESTVQRFIWDGNDLLYETRGPASASTSSASVEDDGVGGTSELGTLNAYGRVAYLHAGGIDRPLGLVRMNGSTVFARLYPQVNWRGLYETATDQTGALYASRQFIKWPGATAAAYLGAPAMPDSEYYWFGTLITQQSDASGLLYRRNRYYDPASGRFTQPDPIGIAGGVNAYGFAIADPISYSDPLGLCPTCGDDAVVYWAQVANNSSGAKQIAANIAGGFAALWTSSTYKATSKTLAAAATGSIILRIAAYLEADQKAADMEAQASIPQDARDVADYVRQNGKPKPGFKGGRPFENDGRNGGEFLPKFDANGDPISYQEWDVKPFQKGVNRGAERVVTGNGKAYYTDTHYDFFVEIK